jgi:hypothetical protein
MPENPRGIDVADSFLGLGLGFMYLGFRVPVNLIGFVCLGFQIRCVRVGSYGSHAHPAPSSECRHLPLAINPTLACPCT